MRKAKHSLCTHKAKHERGTIKEPNSSELSTHHELRANKVSLLAGLCVIKLSRAKGVKG